MTARLLLIGRDGQVGSELHQLLASTGSLTAVGRAECDVGNAESLRALIRESRPTTIINAAAYTAVDRAESDPNVCNAVNAVAPGILGEEAARIGATVIHYSTDYVFDGLKQGPYAESDLTNPQSVYGASKAAGDRALEASGADHVILRTSWVAGVVGQNFAKTILRLAAERESLRVVVDQIGAPTTAALIAEMTALVLQWRAGNARAGFPFGLYHLTAAGEASWHEYACFIVECALEAGHKLKVRPERIEAITASQYPTPARRPANSRLDTSKFRETFDVTLPTWQTGVAGLVKQLLNNPR